MAGELDFTGGSFGDMLTDEERRGALNNALLQAGIAMMGASGWSPVKPTIGQALASGVGQGLNAYQQIIASAPQRMLMRQKLDEARRNQQMRDSFMAELQKGGGAFGLTPEEANIVAKLPWDQGVEIIREKMKNNMKGDEITGGIEYINNPQGKLVAVQRYKSGKLQELPYAPAVKANGAPFEAMVDGRPTLIRQDEYGNITPVEGVQPKRNIQMVDLGGKITAVDVGNQSPGATYSKTPTPGDMISQANRAQDNATALRKEFAAHQAVKNWGEVQPVLASARRSAQVNTKAADLDLVYGAAKVMDPIGSVREGDQTLIVSAGSPAQQFVGLFGAIAGGARLSPTQRAELMQLIESRAKGHADAYNRARATYEGFARKYKINPQDVFVDPDISGFSTRERLGGAAGGAPSTAPQSNDDLYNKYGLRRR